MNHLDADAPEMDYLVWQLAPLFPQPCFSPFREVSFPGHRSFLLHAHAPGSHSGQAGPEPQGDSLWLEAGVTLLSPGATNSVGLKQHHMSSVSYVRRRKVHDLLLPRLLQVFSTFHPNCFPQKLHFFFLKRVAEQPRAGGEWLLPLVGDFCLLHQWPCGKQSWKHRE